MPILETLTKQELRAITGSAHRDKQLAWLQAREWPHETTVGGFPVVLRQVAAERLGAIPSGDKKRKKIPWVMDPKTIT